MRKAFDWRDFLELARELRSGTPTSATPEASARCVVSRAYYAAFCYARNFARATYGYKSARDRDEHELVRLEFRRRGRTGVAERLDDPRQWRNWCDYDDVVGNLHGLTGKALARAQRVIDELTPAPRGPASRFPLCLFPRKEASPILPATTQPNLILITTDQQRLEAPPP